MVQEYVTKSCSRLLLPQRTSLSNVPPPSVSAASKTQRSALALEGARCAKPHARMRMSPRSTGGKQQRVTNLPWNEYGMVHCTLTTAKISSVKNPNMFVRSLNGDGYEICRRGWRVLSYAAHTTILYIILLRPWACAPCASDIARKIPEPAAGATTYLEREPA